MKEKNLYEEPSLEIILINENVITTSEIPNPDAGDNGDNFGDWD